MDPVTLGAAKADAAKRYGRLLRPGGNRAVVTGDSLSDYGGTGAINTTGQGAAGGPTWFNRLCMLSGQRIQRAGSFAVAGSTTQQWHDIQIPLVLAMSPKPSVCFIQIGTNDAGISFNLTAWSALMKDGIRQLLAAGILPILCLTPPRGAQGSPTGTNISTSVTQQHLWITRYAASNGLPVLDNYTPVSSVLGGILTGYNADVTHLKEEGYRLQANDAYARQEIHKIFPPARKLTTKDRGDFLDLLGHVGLFVDSSGTAATTGWTTSGTAATVTSVAPAGGDNLAGNWLSVVRAAGSTGETDIVSSNIFGSAAVGDVIAFSARVQLSGWDTAGSSGGQNFNIFARWTISGFTYQQMLSGFGTDLTDGLFYFEAAVPTGATALSVYIAVKGPIGGGGAVTAKLGEVTAYNLTAQGVASI